MAIITLTSDWGSKDHYAGSVKGAILRMLPEVHIVDISHEIPAHDVNKAAFMVRNFYRDFPEETIHIIDINSDASLQTPHMLVVHHNQYFIATDNGIFSLIFDSKPSRIIEIDIIQDSSYFTFPARDVFAKVACHIASGKPIDEIGPERGSIMVKLPFQPVVQGDMIKGHINYIDNYGNAFTNISETLFRNVVKNNGFRISFRSSGYQIEKISTSYKDVKESEMLALFSTTGYLELAIRNGKASTLLGLKQDQMIIIEIESK
jgi:S-adenosylmethionine hydrolase